MEKDNLKPIYNDTFQKRSKQRKVIGIAIF